MKLLRNNKGSMLIYGVVAISAITASGIFLMNMQKNATDQISAEFAQQQIDEMMSNINQNLTNQQACIKTFDNSIQTQYTRIKNQDGKIIYPGTVANTKMAYSFSYIKIKDSNKTFPLHKNMEVLVSFNNISNNKSLVKTISKKMNIKFEIDSNGKIISCLYDPENDLDTAKDTLLVESNSKYIKMGHLNIIDQDLVLSTKASTPFLITNEGSINTNEDVFVKSSRVLTEEEALEKIKKMDPKTKIKLLKKLMITSDILKSVADRMKVDAAVPTGSCMFSSEIKSQSGGIPVGWQINSLFNNRILRFPNPNVSDYIGQQGGMATHHFVAISRGLDPEADIYGAYDLYINGQQIIHRDDRNNQADFDNFPPFMTSNILCRNLSKNQVSAIADDCVSKNFVFDESKTSCSFDCKADHGLDSSGSSCQLCPAGSKVENQICVVKRFRCEEYERQKEEIAVFIKYSYQANGEFKLFTESQPPSSITPSNCVKGNGTDCDKFEKSLPNPTYVNCVEVKVNAITNEVIVDK